MALKTNFGKAIYDALDNGHLDLAKRLRNERRMVKALVNAILKTRASVSVHNSEEWVLNKSTSRKDIYAAMFTTDNDYIVAYTADGIGKGGFNLVYGNNGWDLVSNSSSNPYCDEMWGKVIMPLSEKIQSGI